jgi:hypothetical protein
LDERVDPRNTPEARRDYTKLNLKKRLTIPVKEGQHQRIVETGIGMLMLEKVTEADGTGKNQRKMCMCHRRGLGRTGKEGKKEGPGSIFQM